MKKMDIANKQFGRLTAIKMASEFHYPNGERGERWLCKCSCGNQIEIARKNLLSGNTQSCGCRRNESNTKRLTKHGGKNTRLYDIWCSMKERCANPNSKNYNDYGGRGITVCDTWASGYETFRDWALSNGYQDKLTIDRIDNNLGYSPDNCRFVDMRTQANNRRNTIKITYKDVTHSCAEWARITGICYDTINDRYHRGLSPDMILKKK